jgi:hypothetical protein
VRRLFAVPGKGGEGDRWPVTSSPAVVVAAGSDAGLALSDEDAERAVRAVSGRYVPAWLGAGNRRGHASPGCGLG